MHVNLQVVSSSIIGRAKDATVPLSDASFIFVLILGRHELLWRLIFYRDRAFNARLKSDVRF